MDLKDIQWECVWIGLIWLRTGTGGGFCMVNNFRVLYKVRNFFT